MKLEPQKGLQPSQSQCLGAEVSDSGPRLRVWSEEKEAKSGTAEAPTGAGRIAEECPK